MKRLPRFLRTARQTPFLHSNAGRTLQISSRTARMPAIVFASQIWPFNTILYAKAFVM